MMRYITLLAATLATASAQYGSQPMQQMKGSSNNMNMGSQMKDGYGQQQQQNNNGYGQMQNNNNNMMMNDNSAWQGMQQSSNMQQAGVVIISTNNGGNSQWKMQSSSDNMYKGSMMGSPQTHMVTVGGAGLTYSPNTIQAKPGDYVMFQFMSENHTATQSNFDKPCVKMMGGMDSGFMPNAKNSTNPPPMMKVQVMNSMPMWFYCKQKMPKVHCGAGMTFSINPTMQKSQQMFQQMAMQQNGTMMMSSSSMSSPPPAQSSSMSNVVQGNGQMQNGQCQCQCLCGSNAYAPGLGVGMMGGMGGMMPMSPAPSGK